LAEYEKLSEMFPELAKATLMMDETGYFLRNGQQRILMRGQATNPALCAAILTSLARSVKAENRGELVVEDRFLNKVRGQEGCPFLKHIVKDCSVPYLAVGPNDVVSSIHEPNESLPLNTLNISAIQFKHVLLAVANTNCI
jgi:hypothetical protein